MITNKVYIELSNCQTVPCVEGNVFYSVHFYDGPDQGLTHIIHKK